MKKNIIYLIINYPIDTCARHLFGEQHTLNHRMGVGIVVMVIGVTVAKSGHLIVNEAGQYALDIIGYAIHGTGLTPFVEHWSKNKK